MARKWILVVDDDPLMLQVMDDFLQGSPFNVTTATDAMQCFIQARDLKPVLIISDIQMPGYGTGDAALRELRKDARLRGIPFIFMTGMNLDQAQKLVPPGDPTVRLMRKPIDWDQLGAWIFELTGVALPKPPPPAAAREPAMIIRKLYRFEAAHIVRNCSSDRCKYSIHGHSFRCELQLAAERLDRGQMVYDFGLLKKHVKDFLDGFDHSTLFWEKESPAYARAMKAHSKRWVSLPVSPTAEQLSRVIFVAARALLDNTERANGDEGARVHSVILHETETGAAQCFREDADSAEMGEIDLKRVVFSAQARAEWADPRMWDKLLSGSRFKAEAPEIQIPDKAAPSRRPRR